VTPTLIAEIAKKTEASMPCKITKAPSRGEGRALRGLRPRESYATWWYWCPEGYHLHAAGPERAAGSFKKALFGAKSERIAPDQYELSLEDIETGIALVKAEIDADERTAPVRAPKERKPRGALPKHLPRVEVVIEPDSTTCSCGHERHVISEDFSERLDIVPAQFHVIVTRRPRYACRACEGSFTQALTFAILPT
jgi:hypothetical protein